MNLITALSGFDGKQTSTLERIDASLPRDEASLSGLLEASRTEEDVVQVGATWLLKRWHDDGERIIEESATQLVDVLGEMTEWGAQLHLLQVLSDLPLSASDCATLLRLLPGLHVSDNKFVRAWSYSVLAAVGDSRVDLRREVSATLERAEEDEAASVRARLRQLRKRFKWIVSGV